MQKQPQSSHDEESIKKIAEQANQETLKNDVVEIGENSKRNYKANDKYVENWRAEYLGVSVTYSPVYYLNFAEYYLGMDELDMFSVRQSGQYIVLKYPKDNSFVKGATDRLGDIDLRKETRLQKGNIIIAVTIDVIIADQIVTAATHRDDGKLHEFYNRLLIKLEKLIPTFEVMSAYVNVERNTLVVNGIPYIEPKSDDKSEKKKRRKRQAKDPENEKWISYSQFRNEFKRTSLAVELMSHFEEQPFYEEVLDAENDRKSSSWKMSRIKRVANDESLSLKAKGLFIEILLNPEKVSYVDKRNRTCRNELIKQGYLVMVRPKMLEAKWIPRIL